MTWINPTLLASGAAGAAAPLVLHLLSRARYRTVHWGAMMFLDGHDVRQRQSPRVQQAALLAMRMLTVALLGAALARPVAGGGPTGGRGAGIDGGGAGGAGYLAEGRTDAVILFDRSASMDFDENGRSRLDLAREAVFQILSTLNKGDQAALVVLGEQEPPPRGPAPSSAFSGDLQDVERRVAAVAAPRGFADVAGGLRQAADLLERADAPATELFVVCDRQASSWKDVSADFAARWRGRLGRLARPPRCWVVPVGSGGAGNEPGNHEPGNHEPGNHEPGNNEPSNVAVESVELVNPPAIADLPAEVAVTVHNYGPVARALVPVTLRSAGPQGPPRSLRANVHLEPGASAVVKFLPRFDDPGPHLLSAEARGAGLKFDKRYDLALEVGAPIKMLIVSGDERETPAGSESEYARAALNPFKSQKQNPVSISVANWKAWNEWDLGAYQVVLLANVPEFTAAQARALEQFVYEGGGLFVALGDLVREENYNETLYRDGRGVLPARLKGPPVRDPSERNFLADLDVAHPVFRFLAGRPDPSPAAAVGQYFPADAGPGALVLGRYASKEPFLLKSSPGRGHVLLLTTTIDADWNGLPLTNFYLPFLQSAVRDLAPVPRARRNLLPGEALEEVLGEPAGDRATVVLPDGAQAPAPVTPASGRGQVRFADTRQIGRYRLDLAGGKTRIDFVVRTPPGESDLTSMTRARWDELDTGLGLRRIESPPGSLKAALEAARGGRELWMPLLASAVVLSLAELVLSRAWGARPAEA